METNRKKAYRNYSIVAGTILLLYLLLYIRVRIYNGDNRPAGEAQAEAVDSLIGISPYDSLFRCHADSIGWDWKLVAAIGYVESGFKVVPPRTADSPCGIMQMKPSTARALGTPDSLLLTPAANIESACRYLARLEVLFRRVGDPDERLKFILSAYNAGPGHILDAMALAEKYERDRYRWESHVDSFLVLKSEETFYNDSVCKSGRYQNGAHTGRYVEKVLRRWRYYCRRQAARLDSLRNPTLPHFKPQ